VCSQSHARPSTPAHGGAQRPAAAGRPRDPRAPRVVIAQEVQLHGTVHGGAGGCCPLCYLCTHQALHLALDVDVCVGQVLRNVPGALPAPGRDRRPGPAGEAVVVADGAAAAAGPCRRSATQYLAVGAAPR
jgi:hypothetical protein